jgi:hypothetical protein
MSELDNGVGRKRDIVSEELLDKLLDELLVANTAWLAAQEVTSAYEALCAGRALAAANAVYEAAINSLAELRREAVALRETLADASGAAEELAGGSWAGLDL